MRSSTSTVRGKKSMPSRTSRAALAVASTVVSPILATTAPCDWGANRPDSKVSDLSVPETGAEMVMASAMVQLLSGPLGPVYGCCGGPVPSGGPPDPPMGPGNEPLAADL